MSDPKRHHYLPRFYLEGFCRDGGLWVFDKKIQEYRVQTPINTALISHYYSFEDQSGKKRNEIETPFAQIEGRAKENIAKLVASQTLTAAEKEELAIFIGFMMNRVPDFEKSINSVQEHLIRRMLDMMFTDESRAQEVIDRWEAETGRKAETSAKSLVEFQKSGEYTIQISRNESLAMMLTISLEVAKYFYQMNWMILHAPRDTSFLTTDNAVIVVMPKGRERPPLGGIGIATPGAEKVFPLSQTACLRIGDPGNLLLHRKVDKKRVRGINLTLTAGCDRFVIAREEALLRSVVNKTKLLTFERKGRFKVS